MQHNTRVIINLYTESANLKSHPKTDPIKKINPNPLSSQPRVCRTRGYDRRAQLLAYARELRQANAPQSEWPLKNSRRKPKPKKWKWSRPVQKMRLLFSQFDGMKRKWKYEALVREKYSDAQGSSRKAKSNGSRRNSHFCGRLGKKLRCFLKEISRSWKCKRW